MAKEAKGRYSRQELVEQLGDRAKELRNKTITVVGLGAVGTVAAEMAARAGVNLRIIDKGRILEEDLQRQSLFLEEDIDKFKAKQAKKRLEDINKGISVKAFHEDLTDQTIYLVESDLVIDCSNDLEVSLKIDKYCYKKKIPMIYCFVAGSQGQVFVVDRDVSLSQISNYVKNHRISEKGIMSATVHMAASIVAAKASKILLKMKHEKNMFSFDVWDLKFNKETVKKNKK